MIYLTVVIISLTFFVFMFLKKRYSYWKEIGVRGPVPLPIVGNFGKVLIVKQSFDDLMRETYTQFPDDKVVGMYRGLEPILLVRDPELIKQMLVKDFNAFQERGMSTNFPLFEKNLFVAKGEIWKLLRSKWTPIFTSGKMKNMMPLVQKCVEDYVSYVNNLVENNIEHEIRSLKSKYTLEVIGSCAFGINAGAFSNTDNEFTKVAKMVLTPTLITRTVMSIDSVIPGAKGLLLNYSKAIKQIQIFFLALVSKTIDQRQGNHMLRKDFMDLMIELKEQGGINERNENHVEQLTLEIDKVFIAAQALVFCTAGYETSAAAMSYLVHELALHQDFQEHVYEQIQETYEKYNGKLTYEALSELTYLGMAMDATLRKYPVAGTIMRRATSNYTFPGTNVSVEKGMHIYVSVYGLHYDTKYFSDPEAFDPEMFAPENKKNLPSSVYLPFSVGPRNCVGYRFAKMQSLLGMAALLKNFKVEPSEKTKKKLSFDPSGLTLTSKGGIWVKISKR